MSLTGAVTKSVVVRLVGQLENPRRQIFFTYAVDSAVASYEGPHVFRTVATDAPELPRPISVIREAGKILPTCLSSHALAVGLANIGGSSIRLWIDLFAAKVCAGGTAQLLSISKSWRAIEKASAPTGGLLGADPAEISDPENYGEGESDGEEEPTGMESILFKSLDKFSEATFLRKVAGLSEDSLPFLLNVGALCGLLLLFSTIRAHGEKTFRNSKTQRKFFLVMHLFTCCCQRVF